MNPPSASTEYASPATNLEPGSDYSPESKSPQTVVVQAGDQRLNSIHFLPLVSHTEIRNAIRHLNLPVQDLQVQAFVHNDVMGVAKGGDREYLERDGSNFQLLNNNCETESWMAALQADNLFRDDTPRSLASLYALEETYTQRLVQTNYSWGLVPHPQNDHISTDRLSLDAFPELYDGDKNIYGNQLLRKYFSNIARTSGEDMNEVRSRRNQVLNWIREYKDHHNGSSTHADLMNYVLSRVLGQKPLLTTTFDMFRVDEIKNTDYHKILSHWLNNEYDDQRKVYNQAMSGNKEKHQLEEGELPFWVSVPHQSPNSDKPVHTRYTLFRNKDGTLILKHPHHTKTSNDKALEELQNMLAKNFKDLSGDIRSRILQLLTQEQVSAFEDITLNYSKGSVSSVEDLYECLVENFQHLSASKLAVIPKSHVLINELTSGGNVLVQPMKEAAYAAEARAYSDALELPHNSLYLKVDVWKLLADNSIRPSREISFLLGKKRVTGNEIHQLDEVLHSSEIQKYLYEALPLMIGAFYQAELKRIPEVNISQETVGLMEHLGLVTSTGTRPNNQGRAELLNVPEIQQPYDDLRTLDVDYIPFLSKRKIAIHNDIKYPLSIARSMRKFPEFSTNLQTEEQHFKAWSGNVKSNLTAVEKLAERLGNELASLGNKHIITNPGLLKIVGYLQEQFNIELSLEEFCTRGKDYIAETIISSFLQLTEHQSLFSQLHNHTQEKYASIKARISEIEKSIQLYEKSSEEQRKQLENERDSLVQNRTSLDNEKKKLNGALNTMAKNDPERASKQTEAQGIQEKLNPIFARLKEITNEMKNLNVPPELLSNLQTARKEMIHMAQGLAHALLKGSRQLDYASYYIDPVQLYVAWGPEAIDKASQHVHVSHEPWLSKK